MTTHRKLVGIAALVGLLGLGCGAGIEPGPSTDPNQPNEIPTGSEDVDNVFDHPPILEIDPFELLDRMQKLGPAEFQSRLHSCQKMRYDTFGRILRSRGVNTASTTANSAGVIFTQGAGSLGTPNYTQRVAEATELTTAVASKMFDIWVAAATEITTAMPNLPACQIGGVGPQFFDAAGSCTKAGIECLTGVPATQTAVDLCNQVVAGGSTPAIGRTIAVAAIASAAHSCE
jgi:hypothetical protein